MQVSVYLESTNILPFPFLCFLLLCMYFMQEKGSDEIVLKAMGRAINKTVMITELIKVGV